MVPFTAKGLGECMQPEWWETEYMPSDIEPSTQSKKWSKVYTVSVDQQYLKKQYTEQEKQWLRPIAETLAMIDGNAFFTETLPDGREWYEQWLAEAAAIFYSNGGKEGWAGETSWMKERNHETDDVRAAYDSWKTLKKLSQ
jgi:hypothetical protein